MLSWGALRHCLDQIQPEGGNLGLSCLRQGHSHSWPRPGQSPRRRCKCARSWAWHPALGMGCAAHTCPRSLGRQHHAAPATKSIGHSFRKASPPTEAQRGLCQSGRQAGNVVTGFLQLHTRSLKCYHDTMTHVQTPDTRSAPGPGSAPNSAARIFAGHSLSCLPKRSRVPENQ